MTRSSRANLARLLSPVTVAVVGANEKLGMSNNAVLPMVEAGPAVHLVNPNRDELYGQKALPSLPADATRRAGSRARDCHRPPRVDHQSVDAGWDIGPK